MTKIKELFSRGFAGVQNLGKALLFPIAMLPIAAIMLRVGAAIPGDTEFSAFVSSVLVAVGNGVFGPALPFLFAIGVGFGLTKDSRGEAAIVAFSSMVIITILMSRNGLFGGADLVEKIYGTSSISGTTDGFGDIFGGKYNDILATNVLNGICVGGLVAFIYNRYNGIQLPSVLSFFSGRRLIPVLGAIASVIFGILWAVIFPWIGYLIYLISDGLGSATADRYTNAGIMGAYGFLNRLLIPFGLHHIPNTLFWFTLGSHPQANGDIANGDIFIFLNGIPEGNNSGTFMSGFFPMMMFGLPAMVGAFYYLAKDKVQKSRVLGVFAGAALVSFFTGITEPVEFAFVFLAPLLYLAHAVLTGFFGMIVGFMGIQLGFGFSAGFIDYSLSIPKSLQIIDANKTGFDAVIANPGWIFVIGPITGITYFFTTVLMTKWLKISTPGRGNNLIEFAKKTRGAASTNSQADLKNALLLIEAVGGSKNIDRLSWCATRLRLVLRDRSLVKESGFKGTPSRGTIKVGKNGYQVIIGPEVEILGQAIESLMPQQ